MEALHAAILTRWNATTALTTGITGGLHMQSAPPEAVTPESSYFAVLSSDPSPPITDTFGPQSYDAVLTFSVFGRGKTATYAKMALILAAFDDQTLTLAGTQLNVYIDRATGPWCELQPVKDKDGEDVWGWYASYNYTVQEHA